VDVRSGSDAPTIIGERISSGEELERILRIATLRGRILIALMAFVA